MRIQCGIPVPYGGNLKLLHVEDLGEALEIGVGYRRVGLLFEIGQLQDSGGCLPRAELYPCQAIVRPEG